MASLSRKKGLLKWVRETLKSIESEKVVASHMHRLQTEFLVPDKVLRKIMRDCLDQAETPEEYVKRWWRLLDFQAVGFQMLIEELQKSMWEPSVPAKPLFRSAERNRPKQLRASVNGVKAGRLGESFAVLLKLGFTFTTDIKEILEERFSNDPDPEQCVRDLHSIKEFRSFSLTTFLDWKEPLKNRFGEEIIKTCKKGVLIDQEVLCREPIVLSQKHRALVLMRAIENGDPEWHNRLQEWLQESKEAYRVGFQRVYDQWLRIRHDLLRDEPCRKGTTDILFFEPRHVRWKIVKLECSESYRPAILYEEVKSWLKSEVYDRSDWGIGRWCSGLGCACHVLLPVRFPHPRLAFHMATQAFEPQFARRAL
jgi:hypothetical protein